MKIIVYTQDKNNNTDHVIDIKATTSTNKKRKKKEKAHSKSVKTHVNQDNDNGTGSPNDAKRKKIDDIETTEIVPSEKIEKKERHDQASTSSSSSASSTPSNATSDDSVIVIEDSYLSLDESSIANITASTSKSDSSANTSHRNRTNRADDFNFDALQTDDETDEEDNTPYAPEWSKSKNRWVHVIDQEQMDPNIIDQFFGCHAESVDLKQIFPAITPIVRRRSTAVWTTPPRYSTLPKY